MQFPQRQLPEGLIRPFKAPQLGCNGGWALRLGINRPSAATKDRLWKFLLEKLHTWEVVTLKNTHANFGTIHYSTDNYFSLEGRMKKNIFFLLFELMWSFNMEIRIKVLIMFVLWHFPNASNDAVEAFSFHTFWIKFCRSQTLLLLYTTYIS